MLRLSVHPIPRPATGLRDNGVRAEMIVGALLVILAWIVSVAMLLQLLTSWWQEIQYLGSPAQDLGWPS